jgi:AcrR family transcriptional regulator
MTAKKEPRVRNAEATKQRILAAATKVFAEAGFDAARVDAIAQSAQINKQLLYHHFGNKDELFTAVLEAAYRGFRESEAKLHLDEMPAGEAVMELVAFTWGYYIRNPDFIRLLNSENQLEARHLKASDRTHEINSSHVTLMKSLVQRGIKEKTIRPDIDPVDLSINIAALSFFYLMNRYTLSTVFRRDLGQKRHLNEHLVTMQTMVRRWITPN